MEKNNNRVPAVIFVLALTLIFPLLIYGFQYVYAVVSGTLSRWIPFLDDVWESAEIDWFEILLTAVFGFLAGKAVLFSEKICPSREGARYLACIVLSALMTIGEVLLLIAWLGNLQIDDYRKMFVLQIIIAQAAFTGSMIFHFRMSGTLSMIFRKKYAAVFATLEEHGQTRSYAYVRCGRPPVKPDGSFDSAHVMAMMQAVCSAVPSYAKVPDKVIIAARLEHLKAYYYAALTFEKAEQDGMMKIVCQSSSEQEVPVEMVTMLREVKL